MQGPTGPTGPTGLAGNNGAPGNKGVQGNAGPIGRQGPTGPPGPDSPGGSGGTGPTGPTGPPGSGAAVTGPTGPTGQSGQDGSEGPTGPTGQSGQDGSEGPTGPTGQSGQDGSEGPTGPTGQSGQDGSEGPTGPTGEVGPTGSVGSLTSVFYRVVSPGGSLLVTGAVDVPVFVGSTAISPDNVTFGKISDTVLEVKLTGIYTFVLDYTLGSPGTDSLTNVSYHSSLSPGTGFGVISETQTWIWVSNSQQTTNSVAMPITVTTVPTYFKVVATPVNGSGRFDNFIAFMGTRVAEA